MSRSGKSNVLILAILTGVFAVLSGVLYYLEEQERHSRLKLEQQVAQLTKAKQAVEEELQTTKDEKSRVEQDLTQAQEETRRLTAQLNEVRESATTLQSDLAAREEKLASISKDLEEVQADRQQLNQRLGTVQEQAKKLEAQLAQLRKERASLEARLEELKGQSTVELEKVVVKSGELAGPVPAPSVEQTDSGPVVTGRILVVNREYDFVVMNVGKASGVQLGDEFEVVREDKTMGRVKVEKIYEALSAAALQPGTDKQSLREGDTVRAVKGGNG